MRTVTVLYECIKDGLYHHLQEPKVTGCNLDPWATSFAHRERVNEVVLALGATRDIKDQQETLQNLGMRQELKEIKADTNSIKIAQGLATHEEIQRQEKLRRSLEKENKLKEKEEKKRQQCRKADTL